MEVSFSADKASLADIRTALNRWTIAVQDRIQKRALRNFAIDECARIKDMRGSRYAASSKHLGYRIKFWPSGVIWLGVGDRLIPGTSSATRQLNWGVGGRARRRIYDEEALGWRTHFGELGFHTYPKGMPHTGHGLGWKRGVRHRGRGGYHRGTMASAIVHQAFGPQVIGYLRREIAFEIEKLTKGRRARRGSVSKFQGSFGAAA